MPDEPDHLKQASTIVAAYLRHNPVATDQLPLLISTVHQALTDLGKPAGVVLTPAVPIRRTVQPTFVVCLECGWRGKTLRVHLAACHGLAPAEYRIRWNLASDHSLVAPAYRERRSMLAKQLGFGRLVEKGASRDASGQPAPEDATPV